MIALLFLLTIALMVAVLGMYISRQMGQKQTRDTPLDSEWAMQRQQALKQQKMPYGPVKFGLKIRWIAIKATYRERVATTIGLEELKMVNWHYGVQEAYENHVFITPPVKGWVLVVGRGLPDFDDGRNPVLEDLLSRLSKTFQEVQFFSSHRIVDYYSWVKYIDGDMVRGLTSFEGSVLFDEGQVTSIETNFETINEDSFIAIAEDWSVNPTLLENSEFDHIEGLGTLGYLRP